MCLIVFAHRVHPEFPLLLVANRDEFFSRPTRATHWWPDARDVFAGRDEEAANLHDRGTWLGVNRRGRLAAVTNFRELDFNEPAGKRTRGLLTADFLRNDVALPDYLTRVQREQELYKGFNLLLWGNSALMYLSNRTRGPQSLPPGIYGLSNGVLDSPWPKVEFARAALHDVIRSGTTIDRLLAILTNRDIAPDHRLPDTGIGLESERMLSPCFIHSEQYGTRATTVVMIGADGCIRLLEQNWDFLGRADEQRYLEINVGSPA